MLKSQTRTLLAIATVVLLGAAARVTAQTPTDTLTDVPFAFTVGKTTLPRDTYRISRLNGHMDAFMISSLRHSVIVSSQPDGGSRDRAARLVFHRYADQYFLREVRLGGNVGFSLPPSRQERDAAEQIARGSTPEVVVVPAFAR